MKQNTRSTTEVDEDTAAPSLDRSLVAQLMAQAKADGVSLTGEGGLLAQLTKLVLEGALEGELTDHLGRENGQRTEDGRSGNYRTGTGRRR